MEVGIRKVFGAIKKQLINQFMVESVFLCLFSLFVAIGLVAALGSAVSLPFNDNLAIHFISNPIWIVGALIFTVVLGLFSGSYPAFMLSSFSPISILRGSFKTSGKGVLLRKSLVVFQFMVSIVMIIGTAIVYDQLQLLRNADKGFDTEQILTLDVSHPSLQPSIQVLKNKLEQNPSILATAGTASMPGRTFGRRGVRPEGAGPDDTWIVSVLNFDEHFVDLMGMEIAQGRLFNREIATDQQQAVIINESMAKQLAWNEPIGKKLTFGQNESTIVGVVKDFHFASLRYQIEPLAMFYNPNGGGSLAIKLNTEDVSKTMAFVQDTWDEVFPNSPLEYRFFDEEFGQQYQSDEKFGTLVFSFTWLAIFIACLGLFGLSAFTAQQKTKEIGVRKVLGASVVGIVVLLSNQFTRLIIIAVLLASPLAYYMMEYWLSDFAYRVDINWLWFLASAVVALLIALATVTYQSVKAAMVNPARSLRCE
tara:strand:- start:2325 stop:3761 length:1437 start_codon:yes stop_codon:yes gene_type:complete